MNGAAPSKAAASDVEAQLGHTVFTIAKPVTLQVVTENVERNAKTDFRAALPAGSLQVLSEVVSTAILILVGCMGCTPLGNTSPPLLQVALGFGIVVMFNVQIFGHVSGAHMNPAVTVASVLLRQTPPLLGACYVLAQCAGSIAGSGLLLLLTSAEHGHRDRLCVTGIHPEIQAHQGLFVEFAITLVLIFVCCSFWDPVNKEKTDSLAIKFGLTITGLCIAGGPFTGASMNPARSLGPAIWANYWENHWVFWLGPLAAAVVASLTYQLLFHSPPPTRADTAEELPLSAEEKRAGGGA